MYRLTFQDGDTPREYEFAAGEVVIGRSPDCAVCLKDFGISRNHARIVVDDPFELALAKKLLAFGECVDAVGRDLTPHLLNQYLFELAQGFSKFYTNCSL